MDSAPQLTREQAQREIDRLIVEDRQFHLNLLDERAPEHQATKKRWVELNTWAAGQTPPPAQAAGLPPRQAARARLAELAQDRVWYSAFRDDRHPDHAARVEEWGRLTDTLASPEAG